MEYKALHQSLSCIITRITGSDSLSYIRKHTKLRFVYLTAEAITYPSVSHVHVFLDRFSHDGSSRSLQLLAQSLLHQGMVLLENMKESADADVIWS